MKILNRILIVRTDRLGDVILSTPVVTSLRDAFPQSYIAFMCRPYTREAVEGHPGLNEVIVYDKYGKHKSAAATLRFALQLRKKRFDAAFVLHPTFRAHFIVWAAGIPLRVGWDRDGGYFLTRRVVHRKQEGTKHETEYSLDLLREVSVPVGNVSLNFPLKKEKIYEIDKVLTAYGVPDRELVVVIHPSASCPSKCWPEEHFILLVSYLKKAFRSHIILVASPQEAHRGNRIMQAHPDIIDLRGQLDIGQLGALIKRAALFISNDSGPVHIAASLDTPVISLFGRKNPGLSPQRWRPLGPYAFYIHKDVGCDKCLAHACQKGFLCLEAISPEEVSGLAEQILQARGKI